MEVILQICQIYMELFNPILYESTTNYTKYIYIRNWTEKQFSIIMIIEYLNTHSHDGSEKNQHFPNNVGLLPGIYNTVSTWRPKWIRAPLYG